MKKFFKILSIAILIFVAVLIILPNAFKGKIIQIVKQEMNKTLNARVDFSGASLGFFRSFPDFKLRLKQLTIVGNLPFEADTLAFIPSLDLTFDFRSIFRGSPYEINKIVLNQPVIKLLVLEDGAYNWDILLPEEQTPPEADKTQDQTGQIVLNMNKLLIDHGSFIYDDREMDFTLRLFNIKGKSKGELSETISVFNSEATADNIQIVYEGVTYLDGIKPAYLGQFEVDFDKDYYTMRNNKLFLNDLAIDVEGGFGFVDDDIIMDIGFESKDKSFRKLLSLVPAIYSRNFGKVQAEGEFALKGFVKGLYGEKTMPGFGLEIAVNNARFKYSNLPESMENIMFNLLVSNKTGNLDATFVKLGQFNFVLAGNPFRSAFTLSNPISDPDITASFEGTIDLSSISKVVPLQPEEIPKGILKFDMRFSGKNSSITKKSYNEILAGGSLLINNMFYQPPGFQLPVFLQEMQTKFTPSRLELSKISATIGESNIEASGNVDNYLAYFFDNELLIASFALQSELLNLNEMLAAMRNNQEPKPVADTVAVSLPELPERLNLSINANVGKILFQDYVLNNTKAILSYKNQVIGFSPLSAEMLGGNVEIIGTYDASEKNFASADLSFKIANFVISQAYEAVGLFKRVAPVAEKTKGVFSTNLKLKGKLDAAFNPVYETMQGGGMLQSSKISIESVNVMSVLAKLLGSDDYKSLKADGIDFAFQFLNGKVFQEPFSFNWGGTNTTISGYVGFDRQIDLTLNFQIPYSKFGAAANQAIQKLASEAAMKGIALNTENGLIVKAKLTGALTNPKISLDYQSAAANIKNEIQQVVMQELDKQKAEAMKKVSEEAQKLLDDARQKGDELILKANQLADKLRSEAITTSQKAIAEADVRAARLEEEGKKKGPLAEAAARQTAQKIRTEALKAAQKIIAETDAKANAIVDQANSQAGELMRKAQEQVDKLQ